jgi:hypothetical protein
MKIEFVFITTLVKLFLIFQFSFDLDPRLDCKYFYFNPKSGKVQSNVPEFKKIPRISILIKSTIKTILKIKSSILMTLIKISSVFEDIYLVLETSMMIRLFDGKSMNLLL